MRTLVRQNVKKQKLLDRLPKAVENLETSTESEKTKITEKNNMIKLVLQRKQICHVKLNTFALSTSNTSVKSPKTSSHSYRKM